MRQIENLSTQIQTADADSPLEKIKGLDTGMLPTYTCKNVLLQKMA